MMFKKAAFFSDIHFGNKGNSIQHNTDCLEFVEWFCDTAIQNKCDVCFFLGDWHHNRSVVNIETLEYSMQAIEKLSQSFNEVYILAGNHDIFHRNRRDVISTRWASHVPNVTIINDWFEQDNVVIAPWLLADDHMKLQQMSGKYLFGHFELPYFYMNSLIQMPNHEGIQLSDVNGFEKVFSGHFHKRQTRNNVTYIGNAFPHNYSDVDDDSRGMMILEWDKEPIFKSWPKQPTFRHYKLSQILDNQTLLKANSYIKLDLDIDITYEEASIIKEAWVHEYNVREIKLLQSKTINIDDISEISNEPVEKIILDQISQIKSEFYNPELLMTIYTQL